jgi:uncharacterized membrane protein
MDAVITPNRSLSPRGFLMLMAALVLINGVLAIFFYSVGAFPIPVFLGLDVLGVYAAFRIHYRGARLTEHIQVSAQEVRVSHAAGPRSVTVWRSPTAFTRVDVEAPGEHDARVRLRMSQRRWTVAAALSPRERTAFAEALKAAVGRALAERG